jgi:hypothetical protein
MVETDKYSMKPGVVYWVINGYCPGLFNIQRFFTTEQEADDYIQLLIDEYLPVYRGGKLKPKCMTGFICKNRAMIEE